MVRIKGRIWEITLTLFFPMFPFDHVSNIMFSGGSKENIEKKRVKQITGRGYQNNWERYRINTVGSTGSNREVSCKIKKNLTQLTDSYCWR